MKRPAKLLQALLLMSCAGLATAAAELQPARLRCEYLSNPLGIDATQPRLSWEFPSAPAQPRGMRQTAYQVLVASSEALLQEGKADLWDSGKVASDMTLGIEYAGRKLRSGERCYWKARTWDQADKLSTWSEPAFWSMGLLVESDWKAKWIGVPDSASRESRSFRDWNRTIEWKQWPAPPRVPEHPAVRKWIDATKMKVTYFIPKEVDGDIWGIERLEELQPAPLFRREFAVATPVKRATLYLCGLGCHTLWINGQKVEARELDPAQSDYDKRSFYATFDVTRFLRSGSNVIGVMLGDGFYRQTVAFSHPGEHSGYGRLGLIAQLEIGLGDGTLERITSGKDWKCSVEGPLLKNNLFAGDAYDARREMSGWNAPGFDDRNWSDVEVIPPLTPRLEAQQIPPIRVVETAKPVTLTNPKPDVWVYDMGVQLFGCARLKVNAPADTILTLRYVESLKPDGTRFELGRMACNQADVYVCKGGGEEWTPSFTAHAFRYVQVEGLPGKPESGMLEGLSIANDIASTLKFSCSSELLNRLHATFARTALQAAQHKFGSDTARERSCWECSPVMMPWAYNFDAWTLYEKNADDMKQQRRRLPADGKWYPNVSPCIILESRGCSLPEGHEAEVLLTWETYLYAGNRQMIERHYPFMRDTMTYMAAMAPTGVYGSWLGDWHDALPKSANGISADASRLKLRAEAKKLNAIQQGAGGFPVNSPPAVVATAYLHQCARDMAAAARLLGKPEDVKEYEQLTRRIKDGFIAKFYDPEKFTFGSQAGNALALWQGLLPPDTESKVLDSLVRDIMVTRQGHFSTGELATDKVLAVLLSHGRDDVAYTLMTKEDFPSFGLMLAHGATTSWETWGEAILDCTPAGNAAPICANRPQSHVQFIGVDAFFLHGIAGIRRDDRHPGFKAIVLQPHLVHQLDWAKADFHSVRGVITSDWKRQGDRFSWKIVIPPNTTATAYVPAKNAASVQESGKVATRTDGVKFLREEAGVAVFELQSGSYEFQSIL